MKGLDEIYNTKVDCARCNNTRVTKYVDPVLGDRIAKCPECASHEQMIHRLKGSQIPKNYIGWEFTDYNPTIGDLVAKPNDTPTVKESKFEKVEINLKNLNRLESVVERADDFASKGYNLLLSGPPACGKTLLATALLKELIMTGKYTGRFVTAQWLIVQAGDRIKYATTTDVFAALESVDFLVIDSFDQIMPSTMTSQASAPLIEFIRRRLDDKKSFILTSNLSYDDLVEKSPYLSGMIYNLIKLKFYGQYTKTAESQAEREFFGG